MTNTRSVIPQSSRCMILYCTYIYILLRASYVRGVKLIIKRAHTHTHTQIYIYIVHVNPYIIII